MTEKLELPDGYVVVCVHCAKELNIEFDEQKPLSDGELLSMASELFHYTEYQQAIKFARMIEERHGIK